LYAFVLLCAAYVVYVVYVIQYLVFSLYTINEFY